MHEDERDSFEEPVLITGVFDEYDPKTSSRWTHVSNGEYELGYCSYEERWSSYGRQLYVLEFQILRGVGAEDPDLYSGCKLRRYVNVPAQTEHFSLRGYFAKEFRLITGLIPPSRLYLIKPSEIYSNCILVGRVEEVTEDDDGDSVPEGARYSRVKKILRRVEGMPPYLERQR